MWLLGTGIWKYYSRVHSVQFTQITHARIILAYQNGDLSQRYKLHNLNRAHKPKKSVINHHTTAMQCIAINISRFVAAFPCVAWHWWSSWYYGWLQTQPRTQRNFCEPRLTLLTQDSTNYCLKSRSWYCGYSVRTHSSQWMQLQLQSMVIFARRGVWQRLPVNRSINYPVSHPRLSNPWSMSCIDCLLANHLGNK